MIETLADSQPADYRELAKRVRSHPFVDGPTRKLVRAWIEREPAHPIPWAPLTKPLSACRVALVSSAGIARHDQTPFDQELERRDPWWSDQSWRPIPLGTTEADVGIYHLHIDPRFGEQDLDCVLPLRRLQELSADGIVGGAATTHCDRMPHCPARTRGRAGLANRELSATLTTSVRGEDAMGYRRFDVDLSGRIALVTGANSGMGERNRDKRFMRGSGSMDEYRADGLALVGATGNGEDEDVPSVRPGVLGALIGNRDNV
jgi:hypothetical protein